jgi:hypothetical protein
MPALTKPYEAYELPGLVTAYRMAAIKVFKGAALGVGADGFCRPLDPAVAGLKFIGVACETVDNAGGAAGAKTVNAAKAGSFVFKAAAGFTPAQADVAKEAHAASDWEAQASASGLANAYKIGVITGLETSSTGAAGVRIRIDNHTL